MNAQIAELEKQKKQEQKKLLEIERKLRALYAEDLKERFGLEYGNYYKIIKGNSVDYFFYNPGSIVVKGPLLTVKNVIEENKIDTFYELGFISETLYDPGEFEHVAKFEKVSDSEIKDLKEKCKHGVETF